MEGVGFVTAYSFQVNYQIYWLNILAKPLGPC